MKRFWLVLLSLGLIMAFSVSAYAVDVKFSGEFYVQGQYLDKTKLTTSDTTMGTTQGVSTAFYFQRLRLKTEFIVSPGLSLIVRANIMDRAWGADRTAAGTAGAYAWSGFPGGTDSAGTLAENQNIAFDWAYIHYVSPIGIWDVGYQLDGPWGTKFGDSEYANPRVFWILPVGNWMFAAGVVKLQDHSYIASSGNLNNNPSSGYSDNDSDKYALGFLYQWKGGHAGVLGGYWRYALNRANAAQGNATFAALGYLPQGSVAKIYGLLPYVVAKIGPVDIQAELWWVTGQLPEESGTAGVIDKKIDNNIMAYVDATVNLGMVYFGGMVVYASGNDPNTTDKFEGGIFGTGENLRPTLILFNDTTYRTVGSIAGAAGTGTNFQMTNGWMFQGRVGVRPIEKLDIMAAVTYAIVDKKGGALTQEVGYNPAVAPWLGDTYGTELDITANYKITNNLTYMLGGGYLWTGNYFTGKVPGTTVQNDYLLINKLTLTF
jgi:hypothetical protein